MTTKVKGTEGIEFPDATVQASAAYTKAESDAGFALGTPQNTTSGTSKDFTGIPAGVKRVTVMLAGVSTNGTSIPIIQLGVGSTPKTSGYVSAAAVAGGSNEAGGSTFSNGFGLVNNFAASVALHVTATFTLLNATTNLWTATINGALGTDNFSITGGGNVALSGALGMVRLTTDGGVNTFDAGSMNISWEK